MVTKRKEPSPDDILGRHVLGYKIDRLIGAGGMGAVYSATSRIGSGNRAAVKVMLGALKDHPDGMDRFVREAMVAGAVRHPHVLEAWGCDFFREDGRLYILMPFIDGKSLAKLCNAGPLRLDHSASIAIQVADGLAAVHEHGVVHRDLKPDNVMITTENNIYPWVKLFDFGVARLLKPIVPGDRSLRTLTGMVVGSPGHMAPEQAAGARQVDARADVYSWGVLCYQMLTARRPLENESWWDLVESARTGQKFPGPRSLRPEIPREWDELIMACLEFLPRNRPSLHEAVRRLVAPLNGKDVLLDVLAPKLARPPRVGADGSTFIGELEARWFDLRRASSPSRRRPVLIAASAAVVVGLGATALAFSLTKDDPTTHESPKSASAGAPGASSRARPEVVAGNPLREGTRPEPLAFADAAPSAPVSDDAASLVAAKAAAANAAATNAAAHAGKAEVVAAKTESIAVRSEASAAKAKIEGPATKIDDATTKAPDAATKNDAASKTGVATGAAKAVAASKPTPAIRVAQSDPGSSRRALPTPGAAGPTPRDVDRKDTGSGSNSTGQAKTALIIVKASPWAVVTIDGVSLGQTTVRHYTEPGTHRIELSGPDGQTATLNRVVKAGDNPPITWHWKQTPE